MISTLVGLAIIGLMVALLLAPVEALGWWAGWYGEGLKPSPREQATRYTEVGSSVNADHFVVFLDGVAKVDPVIQYDHIQQLLDRLSGALPSTVVLADVMPYSVRNLALTKDRPFAFFWDFAFKLKRQQRFALLSFAINARNLLQVLVAIDGRYSAIYGQGKAQNILDALLRHGYSLGSGVPITLVGFSGGAQVAIAAAPFLARALEAPLSLVSLGGAMSSGRGLAYLQRVYHLEGTRDAVTAFTRLVLPGRWPLLLHSHWNRLRRQGRLTVVPMGPMRHHGRGGYFDVTPGPGGESNLSQTVKALAGILHEIQRQSGPQAR